MATHPSTWGLRRINTLVGPRLFASLRTDPTAWTAFPATRTRQSPWRPGTSPILPLGAAPRHRKPPCGFGIPRPVGQRCMPRCSRMAGSTVAATSGTKAWACCGQRQYAHFAQVPGGDRSVRPLRQVRQFSGGRSAAFDVAVAAPRVATLRLALALGQRRLRRAQRGDPQVPHRRPLVVLPASDDVRQARGVRQRTRRPGRPPVFQRRWQRAAVRQQMGQDARQVQLRDRCNQRLARTASRRCGTHPRRAQRHEIQVPQPARQPETSQVHRPNRARLHRRGRRRVGAVRRPVSRRRRLPPVETPLPRGGAESGVLRRGA